MADGVTYKAIPERRLARRHWRRVVDYLAYAGKSADELEALRTWMIGLRPPFDVERAASVSRRVERVRRAYEAQGRNYAWRDDKLPARF